MSDAFLVIIGASIATYLTRFPLMLLSGRKRIPVWLEKYMSYIAPAVLTALIAPVVFTRQSRLDISLSNQYLTAALITTAVAFLSKNMLITVITGVLTVGIFSYLF